MQPKVSIVVPCWGVEKYLNKCVESLVNQTLKDIEIILVDDVSPDRVPEMCDEWAEKDSRIKVIHKQKNGGLGYARNTGLEYATGKYVTFCDSDDIVEPKTYEFCYNVAEKHQLDVVRFNYDRFSYDVPEVQINEAYQLCTEKPILRQYAISTWGAIVGEKDYTTKIANTGSSCMGVYNREFLLKNNLRLKSERIILSEDYEFNYHVYNCAERIALTSNVFYHYFVNPNSLTTSTKNNQVDRAIVFSKMMTDNMLADGYDAEVARIQPMAYTITWLRTQQKYVMLSNMSVKEKKAWFNENVSKDYVKEAYNSYPLDRLPFKHRLSFLLSCWKQYWLSYVLVLLKG